MVKEIAVSIYLIAFKFVFYLCRLFPQKNKIVFVVSFEENAVFLQQELMKKKLPIKTFCLCKPSIFKELHGKLKDTPIIPFETARLIDWCKGIYHLSTSKIVIIDNYYGFLSAIKFRKNVECIQVWHAAGALKLFGLRDRSIASRSKAANRRFRRVYSKFHKVVVGSDKMANIFMEAFDLMRENILPTGVPRTDFFYESGYHETIKTDYVLKYPALKGKKIILYAPTFRDTELVDYKVKLDIDEMYHKLRDSYVLIMKLHPAVENATNFEDMYPDFVYDFSKLKGINEILVLADYLITDYSSVPFEFAFMRKPMIFFPYDLEFYQQERGAIKEYIQEVPGPVVFKTEDIIKLILANHFDYKTINEFSKRWNEYSDGKSSAKLIHYILNRMGQGTFY